MRGYRCDSCMDFAPEEKREREGHYIFGGAYKGPPAEWLILSLAESEVALHFCSPGCLNAFNEKHLEAWTG